MVESIFFILCMIATSLITYAMHGMLVPFLYWITKKIGIMSVEFMALFFIGGMWLSVIFFVVEHTTKGGARLLARIYFEEWTLRNLLPVPVVSGFFFLFVIMFTLYTFGKLMEEYEEDTVKEKRKNDDLGYTPEDPIEDFDNMEIEDEQQLLIHQ